MSHPPSDFMVQYLQPLIGCTVTEVKPSSDGEFTTIVFTAKDGQTMDCELSSDEEGNAPGFLFGLPHPSERIQEESP